MSQPQQPKASIDKRCSRCRVVKPLDQYGLNASRKDGHTHYCLACLREVDKARYQALKDTPEYKQRHNLSHRKYAQAYPERSRARKKARRAADELKKSECEHCGSAGPLQMHHPDYSRPLYVLTLCITCHAKVHTVLRRAKRKEQLALKETSNG